MDTGYILLITITTTLLMILVQRTEAKRRRMVFGFVVICLLIIRHNAFLKGNLHSETFIGFIAGLFLSALFWLFIGKYNPVGTSDNIEVIGMDD